MSKKNLINFIAKIAIFSALSFILYIFPKFPLPFIFPEFLDIQFSNLPALLGGFVLGPLGGVLIVIIRFILKLVIITSSTAGVGEFADLLLGICVVLPSSLIYKYYRNKKGGYLSLGVSVVLWVVSSIFINLYINIPMYLKLYFNGNIEGLVTVCGIIKGINADNFYKYYTLYAVIPFNLLLSVMVALITALVYKRISNVFKKDFYKTNKIKMLVISDSFKGTLSSLEVGSIIKNNVNSEKYNCTYLPISDGGEGFLSVVQMWDKDNLVTYKANICNALGKESTCIYLYDKINEILYFELAECVGIKDLNKSDLNPFVASTYGLGLAVKEGILKCKPKKVILGIGGSASNDGGTGMLEAMGVKFIDKNNEEIHNLCNEKLKDVEKVELNDFNELIKSIQFEVLTDVSNPLLGPTGATYVFSPQKGAKVEELELLENNMKHFSEVVSSYFNNDQLHLIEGTGAAGGVGYALVSFMNAKLKLGIDVLLKNYHFDEIIKNYDIVITGEGRLDSQSLNGKVISGIMGYNPKKLEFVVGQNALEENIGYVVHSIVPTVATTEEALNNPKESLEKLIKEVYR